MLSDLKQQFIALIKAIKDEESIKSHTYRIYSWHELHNDLQLSINQRVSELSHVAGSDGGVILHKLKNKQKNRMMSELEESFNNSLVIKDQNDLIGGN